MPMTSDEAQAFAVEWAAAWNERDIERVLAHFHADVAFTSPTALAVVGVPTVRGKSALRDYWARALASCQTLVFSLDRVVWDAERAELAIVYTSEINGNRRRVSENLTFDAAGLVARAEVFHGVSG
jgi:ketosteroid isomerase-like protein